MIHDKIETKIFCKILRCKVLGKDAVLIESFCKVDKVPNGMVKHSTTKRLATI